MAGYIAQRVKGQDVTPVLPDNLCYMMVDADPQEAISVQFEYEVDSKGQVNQTQIDVDVRSPDLVKEDFVWIQDRFKDMLAL